MPQSRNTSPFGSGTSLPRYKFKVGGPPGHFHVTRGDSRFHTNSAVDNASAYPTPVEVSVRPVLIFRVLRIVPQIGVRATVPGPIIQTAIIDSLPKWWDEKFPELFHSDRIWANSIRGIEYLEMSGRSGRLRS